MRSISLNQSIEIARVRSWHVSLLLEVHGYSMHRVVLAAAVQEARQQET